MNSNENNKYKYPEFFRILWILLGLLTLAGILKSVLVSIDIDESYAIAQGYRLVRGDRLLEDLWEPHQLSGYLTAIGIRLFQTVTGSMDYVVIALRIMGVIIHFLIGLFLCSTLRRYVSGTTCLLMFFLHMNFLAKWIASPEFELMQYWYFLIMALSLIRFYLLGGKKGWLLLCGFCLLLQIMNYPTMILLYPVYLYCIYCLGRKGPGEKLPVPAAAKQMILFTLGAAIPSFLFLGYLMSYMDFPQLCSNLSQIMGDPSHTTRPFPIRMREFGLEAFWDVLHLSAAFSMCYLLLAPVSKILKKESVPKRCLCFYSLLLEIILFSLVMTVGCLLADQNQFFLQERYLLFAIGGFLLYFLNTENKTQQERIFYYAFLPPAAFSLAAVLLLTNMNVNVSYTRLFPCLFVLMVFWDTFQKKDNPLLLHLPMLSVLLGLFVCKLILIRVTGCLPVTMRAPLQKITQGPLKGIWIHKEYAEAWENNCTLLRTYCTEQDCLFYFGSENLLYLCTETDISVASVQGTSVFNQSFLDYLKIHPEKYPTAVAVDLRYESVYEYRYSPYNFIVKDWIEKEYPYTEKIETPTMILYLTGNSFRSDSAPLTYRFCSDIRLNTS